MGNTLYKRIKDEPLQAGAVFLSTIKILYLKERKRFTHNIHKKHNIYTHY
ncbi:hypothetical protein B4121_1112 [Bacillus paralicheniformis]|uniref:Uncharacterized protein n=1 Tax=Bacillus paralicheniformis TaxID=1648923 RepID=A0A7Z0WZX0_9BACI|nr:hypothetical protein B4121_1112 [Bacillus paralicheniformis]